MGWGAGTGTGTDTGTGMHGASAPDADPAVLRESAGPETPGGLPRRVRQASLAPGLRGEDGRLGRARDGGGDGDPADRSPEQARATMSAYHSGWSLGRASDDSAEH